jgi:DNA-binding NarL/FixJ family response regulator
MNIFLVEDSPHICERLTELIEADGKHVVLGCADSYDAAIAGIAATRPDVGLFDIQLKHGSGIDALAEAKRLVPQLVGIILSNKVTATYMAASADAGAAYVLDKSADFERIPEILDVLSKS